MDDMPICEKCHLTWVENHPIRKIEIQFIKNGEWTHLDHQMPKPVELDLELGYGDGSDEPAAIPDAEGKFPQYLEEAERVAERLPEDFALLSFKPELERLLFFYVHKMTGI